jgi:N6-adenosine-specific RNA methylase IME4
VKIDNEFKKLVPSLTGDEFEILEKNILERGIQDSIKVWQGIIIDGHNRYEIALRHNLHYDTKELCFESRQSVIEWMLNNQLGRRNLSPDQLSIIRGKLYNLNKMQGKRNDLTSGQNDHKLTTGQNLADKFKVSEKTVRRDAAFVNDNPEAAEKILKGEATKREIIQEQKRKERQESTKKVKPITGKYEVIYTDPPWKYDFAESSNREIENHYPTMNLEDMKNIEIPCEDNSVLLMWATAPKLLEAIDLIKSWGFTYKTQMIWDKQVIGMGYWCRGQHEILLIATKGKFSPPETENRVSSIYSEKRGKHSKKPDYYYSLIEKMFPNMSYLELFARQKYNDKWQVWGNEV